GRTELWAAHRQNKRDDFGWDPPFNLGCTLNITGADEGAPSFWSDDETGTIYLYFARNLTPANGNGLDIFVTTCASDLDNCNRQGLWGEATPVAQLNSPLRDTRTAISRDGLEMIVTSNRTGTAGGLDLWLSSRASAQDPWPIPINLDLDNQNKCAESCPVVNSPSNDGAVALSWDRQTMIFYSNRPGGFGGNDLYMSTRQKLTGENVRQFSFDRKIEH